MPDDFFLTGRRFGLLLVTAPAVRKPRGQLGYWWLCQCRCGITVVVKGAFLLDGTTASCGCTPADAIPRPEPRKRCAGCGRRRPRSCFLPHAPGRHDFKGLCDSCRAPA